ncbi:MAG: SpoIIE family protein phosphatase, partial [Rhodospirillaceae bacterium]
AELPEDAKSHGFDTVGAAAPYNLNVDHNAQLGVTSLWVNYAMREAGETLGVVGTGIGLTEFVTDFVNQQTRGITAMMVTEDGAIQAHVDRSKVALNALGGQAAEDTGLLSMAASEADREALQRVMGDLRDGISNASSLFVGLDGQNSLVAMAYLPSLDWYTVAVFDPAGIIGVEETGVVVAVLGIALLVTAVIFILGQNSLIIRPLSALTEGAKRLTDGDYEARIPVTQRDELGELTETFNAMSTTIATYTQNLESMVALRTEELSDAYGVIRSSIDYAATIQKSILPSDDNFQAIFQDYFIHWEPRDVVGGDIYWNRIWGDGVLTILGDCTGHGVPGAFMTLISTGTLDRALEETPPGQLGRLVQRVHQLVQMRLNQHVNTGSSDDGLDLGAVYFDADLSTLTFVGARFELFTVREGVVEEIKGTRKSIGYRRIPFGQAYEEHSFPVVPGTAYYLSSDGLIDQVGGTSRRMFGKKRFKALLLSVQHLPFADQKRKILEALAEYQGDEPRRDDVTMIGLKT